MNPFSSSSSCIVADIQDDTEDELEDDWVELY